MTDSKARFRFWIDMLSNLIEKKKRTNELMHICKTPWLKTHTGSGGIRTHASEETGA